MNHLLILAENADEYWISFGVPAPPLHERAAARKERP